VRTIGRLMVGLVLAGLVAGWILRGRVPRTRLPWVIAGAFGPAFVHGVATLWWIASLGVDLAWVMGYGLLAAILIVGAWWWMRGAVPTRPFLAAVAVPVHAFVQVALTSALGRAAGPAGAAVDVLPGVALLGVTVAFAAALAVLLPTREHFPRFGIPVPRWLRALGRVAGRRR
jgi:hypothetical protein